MPPPKHLKKEREAYINQLENDTPTPVKPSYPAIPVAREKVKPTTAPNGSLMKVATHGLPTPPCVNFKLPADSNRALTQRERIRLLSLSILNPHFIEKLKSSSKFDIRAHYRAGQPSEHLHLGEVYSTDGLATAGHAWLIIVGDSSKGKGGIWQYHFIHPACEHEGCPTFLMSAENYLMYVHLRIGYKLPDAVLIDPEQALV